MNTDTPVRFRKSSYSGANNSNCVEVSVWGQQIAPVDTATVGVPARVTPQDPATCTTGGTDLLI